MIVLSNLQAKRLVIRGDIKQWNQMLLKVAHNAGVITSQEYA